ncbi:SAM-dependent DNA methyltransferase, partial [Clostridioides difficile]|nr:SAM-dependent DNA methyltransferase [Clostridioides difficile]
EYYQLMRKSLGNKRKEISLEQIEQIKEIYEKFEESENSKIFDNEDFGYRKVTIERPLKLSFKVNEEAIENVKNTTQFINLAVSKKKDIEVKEKEEAEGKIKQDKLIKLLESFDNTLEYMDRDKFIKDLKAKSKEFDIQLSAGLIKAIVNTIGVRNEDAEVCKDSKGNIESDSSLKDTESIGLKDDVYEYFEKEVKPHVNDAYIDESSINNIGYEIPFTRHFYKYEELRSFAEIMKEVESLESEIALKIRKVLG